MFIGFYKKNTFIEIGFQSQKDASSKFRSKHLFFSWWSWCRRGWCVSEEGRDGSPAERDLQQEIKLNSDTNMMKIYEIIWFWPIYGDFWPLFGPESRMYVTTGISKNFEHYKTSIWHNYETVSHHVSQNRLISVFLNLIFFNLFTWCWENNWLKCGWFVFGCLSCLTNSTQASKIVKWIDLNTFYHLWLRKNNSMHKKVNSQLAKILQNIPWFLTNWQSSSGSKHKKFLPKTLSTVNYLCFGPYLIQ